MGTWSKPLVGDGDLVERSPQVGNLLRLLSLGHAKNLSVAAMLDLFPRSQQ